MSLKLTSLLFAALLGGGCSTQMLSEGWAIHTSSLGASQMAGYVDPVATKTESGDVVFQYDAQVVRYGMLGSWSGPYTILAKLRLTNLVAKASLRPATNFWWLSISTATCPVASGESTSTASDALPLLEYQASEDGHLKYPSRECVMWATDWVWYVPPQHDGDIPVAAVVSTETTTTPRHIYPLRVVLFPVLLVGDILYWPLLFIATGGHPTI